MAAGAGVTKEPGTDPFARAFHEAGFSVLAFDYRRLGESGGRPRQIIRISDQLADWDAAIECARTLPEVDPEQLAIWGYSLSGGHVFPVAAHHPELAAAIAHAPLVDGPAATVNAMRHQTPLASLRLSARGVLDAIGGMLGREPLLVPLAAQPGRVAVLSTPDSLDGDRALHGATRYPQWRQEATRIHVAFLERHLRPTHARARNRSESPLVGSATSISAGARDDGQPPAAG
ncbi:MAG: alpha/beta hydrolase [Solirubrobacteraceae bacterium]